MRDDELDRILSQENEIAPSSGLTASIMDAIRQEAQAPAPIPFPWKRALPGLAALAVVLAASLVYGIGWLSRPPVEPLGMGVFRSWLEAAAHTGASWAVVGALLSLFCVAVSLRLVRARV